MLDEEVLVDLLAQIEERGDLQRYQSVEHLIAADGELRAVLEGRSDLAEQLSASFAALRSLNHCWGLGESSEEGLPQIPGYEMLCEVGCGGMGTVYKALQSRLNRHVAIKIMSRSRTSLRRLDERFRVEAELVARLRHPNIVQIHETGETDTSRYIVLEYIGGGNLARRLGGKPQSERWSAELMLTICRAIDYAHGQGIIHRDLKPSNLLLASDGTLKIADFGLARSLERQQDLTHSGESLGTPSYMAPEQTRGISSPQVDIYAMGAILYELVTGRPPFAGETPAETLVQVQTQQPIAPGMIRSRLSADLEAICLKCLEKDPQQRYPSASAMAEDLARYLSGMPTRVRPLSGPQRAWRWAKRNPRLATLSASVVGLLASVAVISLFAAFNIHAANLESRRNEALAEQHSREQLAARLEAEAARDKLQHTLDALAQKQAEINDHIYPEQFTSALAQYHAGNSMGARHTLAMIRETNPAASTFEWNWLWDRLGGHARQLNPLGGEVCSVSYSPDGKYLVACTMAGKLVVWDAATLQVVRSVAAHAKCINSITFSPTSALAATTSCDKTVKLWNPETWQVLGELAGHNVAVYSCVFSPDGTTIATATHRQQGDADEPAEFCLWDVATRHCIAQWREGPSESTSLTYMDDGKSLLAMYRDGSVRQWNISVLPPTPMNSALAACPQPHEHVPGKPIAYGNRIVASPDAKYLAYLTGSVQQKQIALVDVQSKQSTLIAPGAYMHLYGNFSADGGLAVFPQGAGPLQTVRVPQGDVLSPLGNPAGTLILAAAFSPDSRRVAAACQDETVLVYDLSLSHGMHHRFSVSSDWVGFDAKRQCVYTNADIDRIELHDVNTGRLIEQVNLAAADVGRMTAVSPDGRWGAIRQIGADAHPIMLVDLTGQRATQRLGKGYFQPAFSHDSRSLAVASERGVCLLDVASGQIQWDISLPEFVMMSRDNRKLEFAPDGHYVVLTSKSHDWCHTFDVRDGTPRAIGTNASSLRFTADSKYAVAFGYDDLTAKLFDMQNRSCIREFRGHQQPIAGADVTPDGRTLATASRDGTLRLWHLSTGQEICTVARFDSPLKECRFSENGRTLVCWGEPSDGMLDLHVYRIPRPAD